MSDIVERLNAEIVRTVDLDIMHHEAAGEINRLLAEVASLKGDKQHLLGVLEIVREKLAASNSRVERMREALESIKEEVCGEHVGRWETFLSVYAIRGRIADACDIALFDLPEAAQPIRDETQDFSDF